MPRLDVLQITIDAKIEAGAVQALRGSVWFRLSSDAAPDYQRAGTLDITDLIVGGKTLATLRDEVVARVRTAK